MKLAILSSLLILISCVSEKDQKQPQLIGKVERLDPKPIPDEYRRIEAICSALKEKEQVLSDLISSQYTFNYSQKNCSDSALSPSEDITVSIQRPYNEYKFEKLTGGSFAFNVETFDKGSMTDICANLADLKSPMQTSSSTGIWFTTFTRPEHCASDYYHTCIEIRKGRHVSGDDYKIYTTEWIKFKIRDGRKGFFTERKLVSSADCSSGREMERRATLK
jgi:hypothetical protein